jgi:transcriptional regulator with PAS, ATPase and Fis domain
VDVRVIAATNTALEDLILQRMFREDLFYRLNVIKIELPPLRLRTDDIPLLAHHFLKMYSEENAKEIEGISEEVMEILMEYSWPGNIRELENLIERAVVLSKTRTITPDSLPPFLLSPPSEGKEGPGSGNMRLKDQMHLFQKKAIREALLRTKGVQKKAAALLGVKPTTLNEMIKRLDIDVTDLSDV